MAVAVYPIQNYSNEPRKLPYPVRDGFASKYGQAFKAVQMDDTHNRMRRKWAMQPMEYSITWQFTWSQFEFFEAFIKYDCAQASGYFLMPLYPGAPLSTFRLESYPETAFSADKGCWTVTAKVEQIRAAPIGFDAKPATLPLWPESLGEPEKDGYSISRPDQVTRGNISSGIEAERVRFKDEIAIVKCKFIFTGAQYATFDDFVHNQLLGGLAPFKGHFANGKGSSLTRCQLTDIGVSQSGINYEISLTMELRDFPQMSEFDYRGYNFFALHDDITFSATVDPKFGRVQQEQYGFTDSIKFKVGKKLVDNYGFVESGPFIVAKYKRTLTDSQTFIAALSFNIQPQLSDTLRFSSLGQICKNQYIDPDYIQAGYFADCVPFSVETAGYETFGMSEALSFISSFHTMPIDGIGTIASGTISNRQYIDIDYIEYDYTIDVVRTF